MAQKYTFFIYQKLIEPLNFNVIIVKIFFVHDSFRVLYSIILQLKTDKYRFVCNTGKCELELFNSFGLNLKKFTFAN